MCALVRTFRTFVLPLEGGWGGCYLPFSPVSLFRCTFPYLLKSTIKPFFYILPILALFTAVLWLFWAVLQGFLCFRGIKQPF